MKLSIIICVYNEQETILTVIDRVQAAALPEGWSRELIVVDNCSTDGTRDLLKTVNAENVRMVYQPRNMGKGTSVRTGIPLCTGDYTILQDADLEYDPADFMVLVEKAVAENLDGVYGSRALRDKGYHIYPINYWGVRLLNSMINVLYGTSFTDVASGYKLVRTSILQTLHLSCAGFELDIELTTRLAQATKKLGEAPIDYDPRTYDQGKKVPIRDAFKSMWIIVRDRFTS
ncbi:glycosyltransferase family 2 protein [Thermodesulfobacteriota bacterium]